jgi:ribosomal protein S18 acetylase RimI-like enzyme
VRAARARTIADAVDPHADWPDRTTLSDRTGEVALWYSPAQTAQESLPWADGVAVPPHVDLGRALDLIGTQLVGWVLSTSDARLATALLAAGATQRRHAHSMSRWLTEPVPDVVMPAGLRIEPLTPAQVDRHALALGAVNLRAYPPGHPDALDGGEAAAVSQVRATARGEILGPMVPESRIALYDRRIAGACLTVDRPGEPPHGGPWVIDVFRDPALPVRGIGAALLVSTMTAAFDAVLPGLSLVVSHGNEPARRLYRRLGFVDVAESWTLVLPKENERPPSSR